MTGANASVTRVTAARKALEQYLRSQACTAQCHQSNPVVKHAHPSRFFAVYSSSCTRLVPPGEASVRRDVSVQVAFFLLILSPNILLLWISLPWCSLVIIGAPNGERSPMIAITAAVSVTYFERESISRKVHANPHVWTTHALPLRGTLL